MIDDPSKLSQCITYFPNKHFFQKDKMEVITDFSRDKLC